MSRTVTISAMAVVVCASLVAPASAQRVDTPPLVPSSSAGVTGEIHGIVTDDRRAPLSGVVVSALGPMTAFAVTDRAGRFGFRTLAPGSYLLRAHLQGYVGARAFHIQVSRAARAQSTLMLTRGGVPQVLAAGIGAAAELEPPESDSAAGDDHSELAWRLRHLTRSVLKDTGFGLDVRDDDDSLFRDSLETVGRAVGAPARLASALLTDLPLSGQINLLTSLDRPQDLFSWTTGAPHGAAYVSVVAPAASGDWAMRGALTEGDLSSWMLAGSYRRHSPSTHAYEAGWSYAMQQYIGGNAVALAAVSDGGRTAGEVYAYDHWRVAPALTVSYGARYSRHGYLDDEAFMAPKASLTVTPARGLSLRASAARSVLAPGAQELHPASTIGVWVPPERTFSPLTTANGFRAEHVDHYEVSAEQQVGGRFAVGLRAFRQDADDQLVALFGVSLPRSASTDVGHYHVASAGDMRAAGWSAGVSRDAGRIRGSVTYTQASAVWERVSPDAALLTVVAPSVVRAPRERLHDLTASVDTEVPVIATRVLVVYSAKSSASPGADRAWRPGMRYDVEVRQALPFLGFTKAEWAMLLAVRNRFHEALMDASVYDELLVLRPPKRIVGGLTVQF